MWAIMQVLQISNLVISKRQYSTKRRGRYTWVFKIWPDSSLFFNRELRIADHYLRPLSESFINRSIELQNEINRVAAHSFLHLLIYFFKTWFILWGSRQVSNCILTITPRHIWGTNLAQGLYHCNRHRRPSVWRDSNPRSHGWESSTLTTRPSTPPLKITLRSLFNRNGPVTDNLLTAMVMELGI